MSNKDRQIEALKESKRAVYLKLAQVNVESARFKKEIRRLNRALIEAKDKIKHFEIILSRFEPEIIEEVIKNREQAKSNYEELSLSRRARIEGREPM